MKKAKEYIELIDRKYDLFKKLGKSRMDVDWGKWSHKMNRETRNHPYQYDIYNYWVKKSQLLEMYYISKFWFIFKKRRLEKECAHLRFSINMNCQ